MVGIRFFLLSMFIPSLTITHFVILVVNMSRLWMLQRKVELTQ